MKAYGFLSAGGAPVLIEQPVPSATGRDLLVAIEAIAVNPVDTKIRAAIDGELDSPRIVGWDAAGTVISTGADCELFQPGDRVFYAGDVTRPGCYASHQLVDERVVGHAPKSLSALQAAAMPLTSITAWEALFTRMRIQSDKDRGKTLLVVGGAGGVGSIAVQLGRHVAGLQVVATASRSESRDWCLELGADHVIDHGDQLVRHYQALNISPPDYILCLADTDSYFDALCELVAPQGLLCFAVTSKQRHNIEQLKTKSAGLVWEFMFTRPMFGTADLAAQHTLLNTIADLIDTGRLRCTLRHELGPLNAANILQAYRMLGTGRTIGKIGMSAIDSDATPR